MAQENQLAFIRGNYCGKNLFVLGISLGCRNTYGDFRRLDDRQ